MKNIYYVYELIDPKDNQTFYVGYGKNNRLYVHEKAVKNNRIPHRNKHLFYKIKQILDLGLPIIYNVLYDNLHYREAQCYEMITIESYGRADLGLGLLLNMTGGGEGRSGAKHSEETKQKMRKPKSEGHKEKLRKALIGKKLSEETKEKIRASSLGEKNHFFGKKHSKESNEKNRQSQLGKKQSPETIEKKRYPRSINTKIKMCISHLGKKHSEETKQKIRSSNIGQKRTDITKHNISVSKLKVKKLPTGASFNEV